MTDQDKKLDKVAATYVKIRDARAALKKTYEDEDAKLKDQLETINGFLLATLQELGVESARTAHGTIYRSLETKPSCGDWDAFGTWIIENEAVDALERRVKKSFITEYMETHGDELPPGISVTREFTVTVRRK